MHRGKVLEYLGMTLDYSEKGVVKISMPKYIQEIINDFNKIAPDVPNKQVAAPKNLFTVDDKCEKLSKKKAEHYHSIVAKILFATKRARPDTGTALSFLMTRTASPDKDDWAKLKHLMGYIKETKDMPLTLGATA